MSRKDTHKIGLGGEIYALSLFKLLGFDAQLTFGNKKGGDIYLFGTTQHVKIEVKSTVNEDHRMTSYDPKGWYEQHKDELDRVYYVLLFFNIPPKLKKNDFECEWKYLVPAAELKSWNDEMKKGEGFNPRYSFENKIGSLKDDLNKS